MNNRKFKSKKRKLSDLDETPGEESGDKAEDLDSDSDGESSSSGEEKQDESDSGRDSSAGFQSSSSSMKVVRKSKSSEADALLSYSSDSGDETCEKCAICLRSITSQEVGSPEVCDHLFCSVCITEWSKNSNVCPLDRQPFSIILVRENKNGNVVKKVPVDEHQAEQAGNVELIGFDDTVCEICGSGEREDIMLLCDICDKGFHTICLTPPLENIPDENEWFCPDCDYQGSSRREPAGNSLDDLVNVPSTYRSLRPRIQLVRTRLLERIRVTVNRIVENYVLQHPDELDTSVESDAFDSESESESSYSSITTDSEFNASDDVPSTSGLQTAKPKQKKPVSKKRRRKTTRKRRTKTGKSKTTRKKKTSSTKRKTTRKRTTKKRKTKVRTTKTKKIKVENEDGTITEKIVKTKTYKRRRQKKRKRKAVGTGRRGLRVKSITTPKTVKGRLALTLGMLPPKKPGQLLPDIRVKPSNQTTAIDLNRARAGIPKLHIFEPRDELQYYSSDSDREEFIGSGSGGVATIVQPRTNHLRIRDRKKAALALQSAPSKPKPKPVIEPPKSECVDILGSILNSQAIWHSKNTNVNIKEDGSIEVIKDKNKDSSSVNKEPKTGNSEKVDVREKNVEGMTTQAPMYPGAGSRPGGFRPYNRSGYGESRSGQDNIFSPRSGQSSTSVSFNRFGGPARNDREGYTNYLNNIPQGPTPFCRGGPPLRFRMPARQQLRRITFPARNRPAWQPEEDENANGKEDKREEEEEKKDPIPTKSQEDEDIDLYSDIETNTEKPDNSGPEDGVASYPALGPPPEPSAFLLGLDENCDFDITQTKSKSEVYDPAEPCDSDDEMVIDEKERSMTPDRNESEKQNTEIPSLPQSSAQILSASPPKDFERGSSEDDDDEDCPIFSIYSSATREFSQKEEEERQREIEEDKRKIEEMKLQEEQKVNTEILEQIKLPEDENNAMEVNIKENEKSDEKEEDKNYEKIEGKNNEKVEDKNIEKIEGKNNEKVEDKSSEKMDDKISEKISEKTNEEIEGKNAEKINDKNNEEIEGKNTEKINDSNDEKIENISGDKVEVINNEMLEDKNVPEIIDASNENVEDKSSEKVEDENDEKVEDKKDEKVNDINDEKVEDKNDENANDKKDEKVDVDVAENIVEKEEKDQEVGPCLSSDLESTAEDKKVSQENKLIDKTEHENSEICSNSVSDVKEKGEHKSPSSDSEVNQKSGSICSAREKSSSSERTTEKFKRSKRKARSSSDSESETELKKTGRDRKSDDDKDNDEATAASEKNKKDDSNDYENLEKTVESDNETVSQKVAVGLEGLEVEEVSSDNEDEAEFTDRRSISSLSFSDPSNSSRKSRSPVHLKKRKKNKKKKTERSKKGSKYEDEVNDSKKSNKVSGSAAASKSENMENENNKSGEKRKRKSSSRGPDRQVLGSKENKKVAKEKSKDKDLSWKKPSKKEKNYREGKKRSKDTRRSKSNDRRRSKSPSPKRDRKKKDRKKKTDKKKDIERYDVRKIVKNKEVRKTDAFGRDLLSKSRSISRSRSRTPIRDRTRNMLRRDSRSFSRSRSRSFRRGRSPVRSRRYGRSRTRSRSKSARRSYSRSRSRSRSRKSKKKQKSKDRIKIRSRSRGRKSRSLSRGRRRSLSRSRSRSPLPRTARNKKASRSRRSWSHRMSRSPSFSSRRSRSVTRSPVRMKRSYTRSASTGSWSRGRSSLPRTSSLEKLTVVLTTKDKKKWKKRKEGKKVRREEKKRKKGGNLKEVFASGDNVLVSVNFRNNNNAGGNNSGSIINTESRNTHLNSLSPVPGAETSRKKKKNLEYESERVTKKLKKSNPISKKVVDVALANACPKRAKKLTRLTEKDAEVILKRKPVAVIDLDMSPYREQTPSPVNVVVVSDSGSGDEGKEHSPQRQIIRGAPAIEVEKIPESIGVQSVNISAPSSPMENGYLQLSGPKTPPEPQIKFSIVKPQQLRQIANPLGDDDDDDEDDDDDVEEDEVDQNIESLDRRIEKELSSRTEVPHKGPNTPPVPRGPSTPKTPPSPQSSPDAYDPFEPTKSRSPSPNQADKENRPSPKQDGKNDQVSAVVQVEGLIGLVSNALVDNSEKTNDIILENHDDKIDSVEKGEAIPVIDCSNIVIPNQISTAVVQDKPNESPERKISVVITTPQSKSQTVNIQKSYTPVVKQLPMVSSSNTAPPTSVSLTVSSDIFSMPSPTKTSRTSTTTIQTAPMTGIQRLQHRLGSPVNRAPNSMKTTPEKRPTPRTEPSEIFTPGSFMVRNANKRNGEQSKQPRPLQDATNETIDISMDMDDSPYSPASSEGDDLFDPPAETVKPTQSNSKSAASYKPVPKGPHKSPVKQLSKFDLLFGPSLSPLKVVNKKTNAKVSTKTPSLPKSVSSKPQKKAPPKKNIPHKMDEDQLRILDDLPSSAVELQVKDKFLKKLNRQERVVDEVKTVLKPHYARKHITKEEYKDILRRSVPKICHSRSGEINPSKIQSLIEAYVRKFRHAKKKAGIVTTKAKVKKTMFS